MASIYQVVRAPASPKEAFPAASFWKDARVGKIEQFHPKAANTHRPVTEFRLMWDESALYLRFDVKDRYVRCIQTKPQSMVYLDSCVEFFMQPADKGYLNLECNASGVFLCYHITNSERRPEGFAAFRPLTQDELNTIQIATKLHGVITPEITEPTDWWLCAKIPMNTLAIAGAKMPTPGARWRGNLFKIAGDSSHMHAVSWAPLGDVLDFHQPQHFGELQFQ